MNNEYFMKSHYKTVCEAADITAHALMLPHCSQYVFPVLFLPEWGEPVGPPHIPQLQKYQSCVAASEGGDERALC